MKARWRITMPLGTYSERRGGFVVGDPALWQPLLDELVAKNAHWQSTPPPLLEIPSYAAREYRCGECGTWFLAHQLPGNMARVCSEKCKRRRRAALQRQWRKNCHPARNVKRAEAEARAGRTCEHCGVAIEAVRSTRRFCSDLCRIRAHHQRRRENHRAVG